MVWLLLFVALFVVALAYALLVKVEDVVYTSPYQKELHADIGSFDR